MKQNIVDQVLNTCSNTCPTMKNYFFISKTHQKMNVKFVNNHFDFRFWLCTSVTNLFLSTTRFRA